MQFPQTRSLPVEHSYPDPAEPLSAWRIRCFHDVLAGATAGHRVVRWSPVHGNPEYLRPDGRISPIAYYFDTPDEAEHAFTLLLAGQGDCEDY